ncbi:dienelactone hydrolase family protein [Phenylobacterium sp.]|uniref:dienelactone hydrolase family protein n=1 Tax=Phenylobacterium sp. TaxID=1871053 RepID=UPI0027306E58|nr:dienelactone hydrolase family protein [Phenylobacterium sp.]MDP1616713.1 dienelactone hydrolase family protein [Phenylobacterium sp.]MDP1987086.1 dienelactone hydrolase family protein [Phenylobacterium sp.]
MRQDISIPTKDGAMRAFAFMPDAGEGPWPGVIFYMDAPAIRPALFDMGERLAGHGYVVVMPDLYWRAGAYEPIDMATIRNDEARREAFGRLRASTNPQAQMVDTEGALAWLDQEPRAKADKVGLTGYCMGGGIALRAAAHFPDRIAAAASFHGGNLATEEPDSPHRLADQIKARVLVAGADEDRSFPPEQKARLEAALQAAGVEAEVVIYPGARHGYAPTDMAAYDREASERHWREMFELFDATLKG